MLRARDPERSAATSREEDDTFEETVCVHGGGHAVSGRSFYVWDEDLDEARAWGGELAMAGRRPWNLRGLARA